MKKLIIIATLILSTLYLVNGQTSENETVISDKFHFIAFFPDKPTLSKEEVTTTLGKGKANVWKLESQDVSYEVAVIDYPDHSIEMDRKSLNLFYKAECVNLMNQHSAPCDNFGSDTFFGEYGWSGGRITKELSIEFRMYLILNRLYIIKVVMSINASKDAQILDKALGFVNDFVFAYRKENAKEFTYGIPKSDSQNLKRNNY